MRPQSQFVLYSEALLYSHLAKVIKVKSINQLRTSYCTWQRRNDNLNFNLIANSPGNEWAWPPLHWSISNMNTNPSTKERPIMNCSWSVEYTPSFRSWVSGFAGLSSAMALMFLTSGLCASKLLMSLIGWSSTERTLTGRFRSDSWMCGWWLWWLWSAVCVCGRVCGWVMVVIAIDKCVVVWVKEFKVHSSSELPPTHRTMCSTTHTHTHTNL